MVAVNMRFAARRVTGVERYAWGILDSLPGETRRLAPPAQVTGLAGHAWEQLILPGKLKTGEALWSPASTGPLLVQSQAVTIHDLSPLEHPEWFKPAFAMWYRWLWPALARRVDRLITSSQFSRQRLVDVLRAPAEKVVVAPGGVDGRFQPVEASVVSAVRQKYSLPQRYILYVGSLEPRKNLKRLLRAWELVEHGCPDLSLALVGSGGRPFRELHLEPKSERIFCLGPVSDEQLPALYCGAIATIQPSLYEGFGLTILESLACGTPVLVSKIPALVESAGEAGLYFDPLEPEAIARCICTIAASPAQRRELSLVGLERAHRYTWSASARIIWETLLLI